jgi:hypothetical protein
MPAGAEADTLRSVVRVRAPLEIRPIEFGKIDQYFFWSWLTGER